jgi:hypothetical protein
MHKLDKAALVLFGTLFHCAVVSGSGPFPRLLPPADELHLVLQEEPQSQLPLGPSCGGEASLTLLCRTFTLTLENASPHTIRISGLRCFEPSITFETNRPITFEAQELNAAAEWWPISQPGNPACKTLDWTNTRLRPGERMEYSTRLISPRRSVGIIGVVGPGKYPFRAQWALFGCTDLSDGADCLTPLQVIREGSTVADVGIQEPVTVYSNSILAESPKLADLGGLKFTFEVTIATSQPPEAQDGRPNGCAEEFASVDCAVFHYVIRNLGDRAVRNVTASCSDDSIRPEYRFAGSLWKPIPYRRWMCFKNITVERGILPGGTVEGTFTLRTLLPGYDTSSLQAPGEYQLRFTFYPAACIASPDASFCLTFLQRAPTVTSRVLTLTVKSR